MRCPIDEAELVMTERQGIEIDYCPRCRGVWLDRGELDKIIERSTTPAAAQAAMDAATGEYRPDHHDRSYEPRFADPRGTGYGAPAPDPRGGAYPGGGYGERPYAQPGYGQPGYDQRGYDQRGYEQRGIDPRTGRPYGRRKKKGSFLEDLFDFD
ncbi:zf-TFIIB domain-containing protein [Actinotalea sp. AC32]|nr:zf-TFIIB domain-containing protein [Actinotalea sp. AC32]